MDLNQFPKDELETLLLAVSIAKQSAMKLDCVFQFNQLNRWDDRIQSAIKDAEFVANDLPY